MSKRVDLDELSGFLSEIQSAEDDGDLAHVGARLGRVLPGVMAELQELRAERLHAHVFDTWDSAERQYLCYCGAALTECAMEEHAPAMAMEDKQRIRDLERRVALTPPTSESHE